MCQILGVKRANYYKWLHHEKSNRDLENEKLAEYIIKYHKKYGSLWLPDYGLSESDLIVDGEYDILELAARHGFSYNRVAIKHNASNWGSCSTKGNINLNLNIVRLPKVLQDYVLIHELCHLRHHDRTGLCKVNNIHKSGVLRHARLFSFSLLYFSFSAVIIGGEL